MLGRIFDILLPVLYFTPILRHNYMCRKQLLLPLYRSKISGKKWEGSGKTIIYMVQPETTFSGGLSDRLRGITSIYAECKRQHLSFRVVFEPLHLEDYLLPNHYDWRIESGEICWDAKQVYPCTLLTYHGNLKNRLQLFAQKTILRYYLRKSYRQIHIYSNMAVADEQFGTLFHELFRPSPYLQSLIDGHLERLGGKKNYVSLTFRFRQLLGDFKEGGQVLPESEREAYIQKCIDGIHKLHDVYPNDRLLVTSDSKTFLDRLSTLDYVYVIPGKIVHIGFTFDADRDTYMKSFVDYYMLSYAKKVCMMTDQLLFRSGFPKRAAMMNNADYEEISL